MCFIYGHGLASHNAPFFTFIEVGQYEFIAETASQVCPDIRADSGFVQPDVYTVAGSKACSAQAECISSPERSRIQLQLLLHAKLEIHKDTAVQALEFQVMRTVGSFGDGELKAVTATAIRYGSLAQYPDIIFFKNGRSTPQERVASPHTIGDLGKGYASVCTHRAGVRRQTDTAAISAYSARFNYSRGQHYPHNQNHHNNDQIFRFHA